MQNITLANQKLIKLLTNIIDFSRSDEVRALLNQIRYVDSDIDVSTHHPASDEYLYDILKQPEKNFGFPRKEYALNACPYARDTVTRPEYGVLKRYDTINTRLTNFLGARSNAVALLYPPNGFLSWHHNGNAPGYNVLFSYSEDGNGSFDYWDQNKKEIVIMKDSPGWSVKVGRFPGYVEGPKKLFWHRAKTICPRITVAYVIDQKDLWIDMIKEISENNFDNNIIR